LCHFSGILEEQNREKHTDAIFVPLLHVSWSGERKLTVKQYIKYDV
jgi:hypothetical protein